MSLLFEEVQKSDTHTAPDFLEVLIINKDGEVSNDLKRLLKPYTQKLRVTNYLYEKGEVHFVDLIFMDVNMGAEDISKVVTYGVKIVITGETIHPKDAEYMRENLGIGHFCEFPISDAEIQKLFRKMKNSASKRALSNRFFDDPVVETPPKKNLIFSERSTSGSKPMPKKDPHLNIPGNELPFMRGVNPEKKESSYLSSPYAGTIHEPKVLNQMTTFFGGKGGTGKTTTCFLTAWNLNQHLAHWKGSASPLRVIVVDFDIYRGDIVNFIGMDRPNVTLFDWVGMENHLSWEEVEDLVIRHSSGLYVLPAPMDITHVQAITVSVVEKVLSNLQNFFDVIIVDTGYVLNDLTMTIFDFSNRINMVTIMDRSALKDTYSAITDLITYSVAAQSIRLIFNLVRGDEKLPKQIMEGFEVNGHIIQPNAVIPYEKLVYQSINENKFLNYQQMKKGFAQEAGRILEDIIQFPNHSPFQKKKSFFSFFRK